MKIKIEFELDHNETLDAVTRFAGVIQQSLYDLNDTLRERRSPRPEPIFGGQGPLFTDPYFVIKVQDENGVSYLGRGGLFQSATDEYVLIFWSQAAAEQHLSENNKELSTEYPDHAFSIIPVQ